MTKRSVNAGIIQQRSWPDKLKSLEETGKHIKALASTGTELVLLQELHGTNYFCQSQSPDVFDLAEPLDGPTIKALSMLAQENSMVIVGSIFEKRGNGIYHNTAVVLEKDGAVAGIYRKMHIPDDPGFHEKYYFTPGDATGNDGKPGITPIPTSVGRLGVMVCWDQWYPEAARLMALAGADILLYPTAIGWDPEDTPEEKQRQREAWITIQRAHAIANHLPVLVANRIGHEADPSQQTRGIDFWGSSFIAGPQGEILSNGPTDSPGIAQAQLDLARTEKLRRVWPYFRDRRIDAYEGLLLRSGE